MAVVAAIAGSYLNLDQGKTSPGGRDGWLSKLLSSNSGATGLGSDGAMSKTTRATLALARLGVKFALHSYDYDPDADRIGLQAAAALGIEPRRMLKTLMAEVDGKPVCVVVPSDREVSMKKLAAAFAGKAANMMRPADAERLTGYHVGGISPFAQKKRVAVAIDAGALNETTV
jgi:Cys-tRNA(Pro)/Cys-tRNA(Cys) deacylase